MLWLRLPLPMALDHVNVYALDDGDGWTLVDTGLDTAARPRDLGRRLLAGPLAGRPVRAGASSRITTPTTSALPAGSRRRAPSSGPPAPPGCSRGCWCSTTSRCRCPRRWPSGARPGWTPGLLARRAAERPFNFADVVAPLPLGFTPHRRGRRDLHVGGRDWRVRIGHGHAPEQATLWERRSTISCSAAISSCPASRANLGVYATEPDADPVGDWLASCRSFQPDARPDHLVLPGHKLPFTGLPLRLEQMIENHLSARLPGWPCCSSSRGPPPTVSPRFSNGRSARANTGLPWSKTVAHLNHLHAGGAGVAPDERGWSLAVAERDQSRPDQHRGRGARGLGAALRAGCPHPPRCRRQPPRCSPCPRRSPPNRSR